jgi:hypothetical protein
VVIDTSIRIDKARQLEGRCDDGSQVQVLSLLSPQRFIELQQVCKDLTDKSAVRKRSALLS